MILDGHTATSVAQRLGIDPTLLYKWKARQLEHGGPVASTLEDRVKQLEAELLRVTRERDVLKNTRHVRSQRVSNVYAAIEAVAQNTSLPWVTICDVLEVSCSAYCQWLTREPDARERELDELTPAIVEIFVGHRRLYGA